MPSTTHICPRQAFARGCPRPRRPIRPRQRGRPTVPQAAKHRPTQGASAGAQAGRDWKICGGWLCTHPLFQNAMCKSHKLHCFSKPLLEKALTARRRRVIVTGACARPKAFFLPSGFFAPFFSRPFVMQPFDRRPTGRRARFDEGQSAFLRRPPRRRLPRRMGNADAAVFMFSILSIPSYFPYFSYYPYPYAALAADRGTNRDTQTGKRRFLPKKRNAVGSSICSRRHRPLTGRLPPICAPDRHMP